MRYYAEGFNYLLGVWVCGARVGPTLSFIK